MMSCGLLGVLLPLWCKTKSSRIMKKDLNIEEQKVRMVKVKKPRFDMGGMINDPTMPRKGKWLSAIGWVPSDDKNWMPVKLRAMKDATASSHGG